MLCSRRVSAVVAALLTAAAAATNGGTANAAPAHGGSASRPQVLAGSVAAAVSPSAVVGSVSGTQTRSVQLWLAGDQAGAQAYAAAVSTPGNAGFHHYLSPAAYTARFGASTAQVRSVETWLSGAGFTGVSTDAQRNYVQASAPTSTIATAFKVTMRRYRGTDAQGKHVTFESNDRNVTLAGSIASSVLAVTGLNSAQPVLPLANAAPLSAKSAAKVEKDNCSTYYGQKVKSGLPAHFGATSFPTHVCGYNGTQLRSAYGMNSTNIGTGQVVAYIELGLPYKMFNTLTTWAKAGGLPAPVASRYRQLAIGRGGACGNFFDIEEQLDIEAGYAMAPGQTQLLIGGDTCNEKFGGLQALFDADVAVLDGNGTAPLATIASNSWGFGGDTSPAAFINAEHAIMVRAAAEGVGMYFSTGDEPGVQYPSADPDAIAVGGTSLGINQAGQRSFETGWSNDLLIKVAKSYFNIGIVTAGGGGTSLLYAQPGYQHGVVPTGMATPPGNRPGLDRTAPDISAVADLTTGIGEAITFRNKGKDVYVTFPEGGTSLSSPLVAGMVAAAQQGQPTAFGFINPVLYTLAGTSAVHDVLPVTASTPAAYRAVYCADTACIGAPSGLWTFDAQSDKTQTAQVTATGYDTMTGIGSPNGQTFITALRSATG